MIRQLLLPIWYAFEDLMEFVFKDYYTFGYPPLEIRRLSEEDYEKYWEGLRRLSEGKEKSVTVELSTGPMTIYIS